MINGTKHKVNLAASINADTFNYDIQPFDPSAKLVDANTIERNGGVTNNNVTETALPYAQEIFTDTGKVLAETADINGITSTISYDGQSVGTIDQYGVERKIQIKGATDAVVFESPNDEVNKPSYYQVLRVSGNSFHIANFSLADDSLISERTTVFTNLASLLDKVTDVSIERNVSADFYRAPSDTVYFAVRLGDQVVRLNEADPTATVELVVQSIDVIGGNTIRAVAICNNILYFGGDGGRVGSFDGTNWRNYDGTGTGTGGYNNGTAIGTNNILSMASANNQLYVAGVGGRIASYDGANWKNYNGTGVGLGGYSNAALVGANDISCMAAWGKYVVAAAGAGLVGCFDTFTSTAVPYNTAVPTNTPITAPISNQTVISTNTPIKMVTVPASAESNWREVLYLMSASTFATYDGAWVAQTGIRIPLTTNLNSSLVDNANTTKYDWLIGSANGVVYAVDYANQSYYSTSPQGVGGRVENDIETNWQPTATNYPAYKVSYNPSDKYYYFVNSIGILLRSPKPDLSNATTMGGGFSINLMGKDSFVAWGDFVVACVPDLSSSVSITVYKISTNTLSTQNVFTLATHGPIAAITCGPFGWVAVSASAAGTSYFACASDPTSTWTYVSVTGAARPFSHIVYNTYYGVYEAARFYGTTVETILLSPDKGTGWEVALTLTVTTTSGTSVKGMVHDSFTGRTALILNNNSTNTVLAISSLATSPTNYSFVTTASATTPTTTSNGQILAAYAGGFIYQSVASGTNKWVQTQLCNLSGVYSSNTSTDIGTTLTGERAGSDGYTMFNPTGSYMNPINPDGWRYNNFNISGVSPKGFNQEGISYPASLNGFTINSMAADGTGVVVGIGSNGRVYRSTNDGEDWLEVPEFAANLPYYVVHNGTKFLMVVSRYDTTGTIWTSTDGATWSTVTTNITLSPSSTGKLSTANGLFFLGEGLKLYRSADGVTWTDVTPSTAPTADITGVVYTGSRYVLCCNTNSTTRSFAYSTDGATTWTWATITGAGGASWRMSTITQAGGTVLIAALSLQSVSTTATICTSTDGATWTYRTVSAFVPGVSILGANGRFIVPVTPSSGYYSSSYMISTTDAVTWTYHRDVLYRNSGGSARFAAFEGCSVQSRGYVITGGGYTVAGKYSPFSRMLLNVKSNNYAGSVTGAMVTNPPTGYAVADAWIYYKGLFYNPSYAGAYQGKVFSTSSLTLNVPSGIYYANISPNVVVWAAGAGNLNYMTVYSRLDTPGGNIPLFCITNNANNRLWFNSTARSGKYAYVQQGTGANTPFDVRTTQTPTGSSSGLSALGLAGTYSVNNVTANLTGSGGVLKSAIGWNYADVTFKNSLSAVNIYNYATCLPNQYSLTSSVTPTQGNTNNIITGYGRLLNVSGLPEIRVNYITAGDITYGAYLSAAVYNSTANDGYLGVPLHPIGAFDDTYTPIVYTDSTTKRTSVLYRSPGNLLNIIRIGKNVTNRFQKITSNLYKLNTISPLNLFDTDTGKLYVGSNDYNGRVQWLYTGTPTTTSVQEAAMIYTKYSNSIDVGAKLVNIPATTSGAFRPVGYNIPYGTNANDYSVDIFTNNNYTSSWFSGGHNSVLTDPLNAVYATESNLPTPIGSTISNGAIQEGSSTLILTEDYDGYLLGNELNGTYTTFQLYGQTYLFDGKTIYLANIQSGIVVSYNKVCDAKGLVFIAQSPTQIYFLSSFDNSLYTFDGGRVIGKSQRLTNLDRVTSGAFSVKDGTLYLDATNYLITIRDGVITQIRKDDALPLRFATTEEGTYVYNNTVARSYTYYPTDTSTVLPFLWQSGFYGTQMNEKSLLSEFVVTVYDESKSNKTIKATIESYDESTSWSDTVEIKVKSGEYTKLGVAKFRVQPKKGKALGISLKLESNDLLLVTDVDMVYNNIETAGIRNSK